MSLASRVNLTPIEKSLLPDHSLREVLISIKDEIRTADPSSPRTIKALVKRVHEMMKNFGEEQKQFKEIHEKMKSQCTEELAFRDAQIEDAMDANRRSKEAELLCEKSLQSSTSDRTDVREAIESYNFYKTKADNERKVENKLYKDRKNELEEGIAFVKGFVKFLKENFPNPAFKANFIEMSEDLLRHASNAGALSETIPVLIAISAVSTGENNENVIEQLKTTLASLQDRLQDSWNKNEKSEKSNIHTYTKYATQLTVTLGKLDATLKALENQIVDMSVCAKEEALINKTALSKLSRNESLKKSGQDMCDKFDKQYVDSTKAKVLEVSLFKEILAIIDSRFKNVPEDLHTYLQNVEEGWKDYINSTEFKKFEEYKHKTIENSFHGQELATSTVKLRGERTEYEAQARVVGSFKRDFKSIYERKRGSGIKLDKKKNVEINI
jgi:hypothetical protein